MADSDPSSSSIRDILEHDRDDLVDTWVQHQREAPGVRADLLGTEETRSASRDFLELLSEAPLDNADAPGWEPVRSFLRELSSRRARDGFSPSETATFVFSLKQPLFERLQARQGASPEQAQALWSISTILDRLGLLTFDTYLESRETVIRQQQEDLLEVSTPVVKLWDRIVAVPLIGTLDSARAQLVMETLLEGIVDHDASVAILDITGVSTVDTLVAQHIIKTVAAARLMGAECIISGIRPDIAQTMVHLGIRFEDVPTKSTLAGALRAAFALVDDAPGS